jgi:hypothetical protein
MLYFFSVYPSCSAPDGEFDTERKQKNTRQKGGIIATKRDLVTKPWLAKLHGRSLSSIGQIVTIRIHRKGKAHPGLLHIFRRSSGARHSNTTCHLQLVVRSKVDPAGDI